MIIPIRHQVVGWRMLDVGRGMGFVGNKGLMVLGRHDNQSMDLAAGWSLWAVGSEMGLWAVGMPVASGS